MSQLCYFCCQPMVDGASFVCSQCAVQLKPRFQLLPDMPNIEIGGYFFNYCDHIRSMIRSIKFDGNIELAKRFSRVCKRLLCHRFFLNRM